MSAIKLTHDSLNTFFSFQVTQTEKEQLFEMFPNKDDIITSYINQGFKTEKIVNLLLLDDDDGDLPKRLSNVEIFAQELKVHAMKTFDQSRSHFITTTRSCIFNSGLSYYKMVKNKTSLLTLDS